MEKKILALLSHLPTPILLWLSLFFITVGLVIIPAIIEPLPKWLQRKLGVINVEDSND
jgi:hypothetical protein